MERTAMIRRLRTAALVAAVAPLVAACGSMVDNETMGTAPTTTSGSNANVNFVRYAAIGTSLGAGLQSGGINDSTQRKAYPYLLAQAMGLTPGVNWYYPSLTLPGCPAPYTNIGTGSRVNGATSTFCGYRAPSSVEANVNNTSIPGIRAYHVLDISLTTFPTDNTPNRLSQFMTGNVDPITMVSRQGATFVTLEVGANDALQAALGGDVALLTPLASFTATMDEIADSLDALGAPVAIGNIPDVTLSPHMSRGFMFYCLKNGCGAPLNIPAVPPFSGANFVVMPSCQQGPALGGPAGGKGDSTMVAFPTTAGIAQSLTAGAGILLDCAGDSVRINVGAGFVVPTQFPSYILTPSEYGTIRTRISQFNAHIATLAGRANWTLVDINAALLTQAGLGKIPPFPNLAVLSTPGADPNLLFGTPFGAPTSSLFSQDGFHPNDAGARILAQTFATAINAEWGTSLVVP